MMEQEVAAAAGRFGHYVLLDRLSDSHFGPRWRVRGNGDSARALRVINTEAPERFASAAAAIRGVAHPSLLPPIELVRPGRGLAIVTEDVAGETLRALLERAVRQGESIPEPIALRSVIDLLEALQALEEAEGSAKGGPHLHGGLTPDSIHVGADGRTRLLDPGVAALAAREPVFARNPVLAAYTAPEHAEWGAPFDARSDVFSLGVVLWELTACRSLFGAPSYEAVIARVLHEPIPRIQRERFLRGEPVSAALAVLVGRALQREVSKRFQSYAELGAALRGVGRVADHDEVASFLDGGMRATGSELVSSRPAPGLTTERPRPIAAAPTPDPLPRLTPPLPIPPTPIGAPRLTPPNPIAPAPIGVSQPTPPPRVTSPTPVEVLRSEPPRATSPTPAEVVRFEPPRATSPTPVEVVRFEPPRATSLTPVEVVRFQPPLRVEVEADADPPPTTPSARPEHERSRARLEVLMGALVVAIGLAAAYALWDRGGGSAPPTTARPAIDLPIASPPQPTPLPKPVASAPVAVTSGFAPTPATAPSPVAVPIAGGSAAGDPEVAAPKLRRAPRVKREPARAPAIYIPDGI